MRVLLFEIVLADGTTYDFSLHAKDIKHAESMLGLMHKAEYVGELEMPDSLMWASETLH